LPLVIFAIADFCDGELEPLKNYLTTRPAVRGDQTRVRYTESTSIKLQLLKQPVNYND